MKHARLFLLLIISSLLFSCKKDKHKEEEWKPDPNCTYVASGKLMVNPYSTGRLAVSTGVGDLKPTHMYIKVLADNPEVVQLLEASGDFLPFDWRREPNADLSHHIESDEKGLWMYGMVPVSQLQKISRYEVLDDAYYPQAGDPVWQKLYGEISNPNAKASRQPVMGSVMFYDPIDGVNKPLKGITVIIRDAGRITQAITDEAGAFSAGNQISSDKAEVLLKFESSSLEVRTLDLNNPGLALTPSTISLGMKEKCAFQQLQIQIGTETKSNDLYYNAAAYFSYQQFREFAAANGYGIPDKKLNLWVAKDVEFSTGYAAPMLRHVGSEHGARDLLVKLFNFPPNLANGLANLIKKDLPDIYAPYESKDPDRTSPYHLETLYHEFGHSTQYTRSGKEFWSDYIEHIFNNGGYGSGGGSVPGLVAMSEAWAEDFSFEMLAKVYGSEKYPHEIRDRNVWTAYRWIPVGIYYDLIDEEKNEDFDNVGGFTFPELYQIFAPDVRNPQQFRDQLFIKYPAKAEPQRDAIFNLFSRYGYN